MIENIKIKSNKPFVEGIKTIEFGRVNTIIGPKGGGKSTLFNLLANLPNQTLLSTVDDALKEHDLEIVSVTIDGETIPLNSLSREKASQKNKDNWYQNRNDVIFQDDPIKKNLSASKDFEKAKMDFAKDLVSKSKDPIKFIDKIKNLYDAIYKVVLKDKETINWSNALQMSTSFGKEEKVIFDLNYSSNELIYVIRNDKKLLEAIKEELIEQNNYYKHLILSNEEANSFTMIDRNFKDNLIKNCKKIIELVEIQLIQIGEEIKRLDKIIKAVSIFDQVYKNKVSEIKKMSQSVSKLAAYQASSKSHFQEMARLLKNASLAFDEIINSTIELNLKETISAENMLDLSINETIIIEEEEKYDLLKKVLYNPKKVKEDVEDWIESARINEDKGFKQETILNHLASKIVKEKIKVLADGKDYETMSLGQKSIYGIRYKFNHSVGRPIFLDQPEDNLDNNTIATNILDLINSKNEQVFIVTHNANIGILTRPDKVIVANFQDIDQNKNLDQYQVGTIKADIEESDSAFYLEGGLKYIQDRLNIIKGEK